MPHFSVTAKETPAKPAYIMANTGEVITYAELDSKSNQIAQLFRLCGLRKGDHIAMMMVNCSEFLQIATAAMRTGLIFTPISTHLKVDETAYILENCGAKLFVASAALEAVATQLRGKVAGIERFYMVRGISDGF